MCKELEDQIPGPFYLLYCDKWGQHFADFLNGRGKCLLFSWKPIYHRVNFQLKKLTMYND